MRICDDRLYFIVPEDHSIPHRISVWCILHKNEFFNSYVMVGDGEKNEIFLEFSSGIRVFLIFKMRLFFTRVKRIFSHFSDMLSSSLNSIKANSNVLSLKIKLTHKVAPCITLELALVCLVENESLLFALDTNIFNVFSGLCHWFSNLHTRCSCFNYPQKRVG